MRTGARVGALVAPFTDPFSGQPENKATPASIAPHDFVFRGFALSRKPLALPAHAWSARVAVNGGHGYLFADNADLKGWQSWLKSFTAEDIAEYDDLAAAPIARHRLPATASIPACSSARRRCRRLGRREGPVCGGRALQRPASHAAVGQIGRRSRRRRADRLRLFRRRPQHHLRQHRGRRAHRGRHRIEAQGRHQLRLLHSGTEAADRADGSGRCGTAQAGGQRIKASQPSLRDAAKQSSLSLHGKMDCFASLAMTGEPNRRPQKPHLWCARSNTGEPRK